MIHGDLIILNKIKFNKEQYFLAVRTNVKIFAVKIITIRIVFGLSGGSSIIFQIVASVKQNKISIKILLIGIKIKQTL